MLWLYFAITLGSMFFVTAAVGAVTAGFMDNLFGISAATGSKLAASALVFMVCFIILAWGRYSLLDSIIKIIGIVMVASTITAFIIALFKGPTVPIQNPPLKEFTDTKSILVIIALMGWMPTALDLSTWNSLWTLERIKQSGYQPSLKETLREFGLGYWISAGLSVCFLTLGAFLIFGPGIEMPQAGAAFASAVIDLYAKTIGPWSYWIMAVAGFSIMFGTSIGVFDGYARALERTSEIMFGIKGEVTANRKAYLITLIITALGGFFIIFWFSSKLLVLIDVATTISFLIAPIIAIANYYLVTGNRIDKEKQPSKLLHVLSILGIIFLTGFSILYLYMQTTH